MGHSSEKKVLQSSQNNFDSFDEGNPKTSIPEADDRIFYQSLSAKESSDVISGLIYFQEQLSEQNKSSLLFIQSNKLIPFVFKLLISKEDIPICIESMKLLKTYPFEDDFFLKDSIITSLAERFMQLLKSPYENIQMDALDFLIFFGQVYFPFLAKIGHMILPFLFTDQPNLLFLKLPYLESIFKLIDVTLAKIQDASIAPRVILDCKVILLPQTGFHIQRDIYTFLQIINPFFLMNSTMLLYSQQFSKFFKSQKSHRLNY